jgi:hypothetical protein
MQWDATLSKLAKEVADKHNVPTDQAKLLVETYVSCNMKAIRQFQPVIWINIGKFHLSHFKAVKAMLKTVSNFRKGILSQIGLEERFCKIYPVLMAARWHDPRDGKRYRFSRYMDELQAQGKKFKRHRWLSTEEYKKCQEESTQE